MPEACLRHDDRRGSEAIMAVFSETYDSRFGLIGSEAIMV
jgi:hypothetical protein